MNTEVCGFLMEMISNGDNESKGNGAVALGSLLSAGLPLL